MTNDQLTRSRERSPEVLHARSAPAPKRPPGRLAAFDLTERIASRLTEEARLEPTDRWRALHNLRTAGGALFHMWKHGDGKEKKRARNIFLGILGLLAVVVGLLIAGVLGDIYKAIYTFWPGRAWTKVMRDHAVIYVGLLAVVVTVSFLLSHRSRWGRALVIETSLVIGFVGGHVVWAGKPISWW